MLCIYHTDVDALCALLQSHYTKVKSAGSAVNNSQIISVTATTIR